jgi:cytochrome c oxidase cbb3-type subunit III
MRARICTIALIVLSASLLACEREEREFRSVAPTSAAADPVRMSALVPGPPTYEMDLKGPYDNNAYAISEGKQLYGYMNCVGCHAWGGGGIGPALMDDEWIYGSEPENIFATIVQGRPNGMPSFRGRLPNDRIWMLVAYVRSMSGLTGKNARPGRNDDMAVSVPERMRDRERPRRAPAPPALGKTNP